MLWQNYRNTLKKNLYSLKLLYFVHNYKLIYSIWVLTPSYLTGLSTEMFM